MVYLRNSRRKRGWTEAQIIRHFIVRGSVIVLVHFALSTIFTLPRILSGSGFAITYNVLYVLGLSMLLGSFLLKLSPALLTAAAIFSLALPEFLLPDPAQFSEPVTPLLRLLAVPGFMGGSTVLYTLFPWIGLAILGFVFGKMMLANRAEAYRKLPLYGIGFIAMFLVVRLSGGFGNIRPIEGTGWMAFLRLTKYPPSLAYALLMMGINFFLLYLFEQMGSALSRYGKPLLVFGRSALFFYVLHHFIYIIMAMGFGLRRLSLVRMYPFWLLGLVIAYPLCQCYERFKHSRPAESMWRLF